MVGSFASISSYNNCGQSAQILGTMLKRFHAEFKDEPDADAKRIRLDPGSLELGGDEG